MRRVDAMLLAVPLAALLVTPEIALGRLIDTTLEEIVSRAPIILHGETRNSSTPGRVPFVVKTVLKSPSPLGMKTVALCNDAQDVEAYDLSKSIGEYIVFVQEDGKCFKPVYGIRSVFAIKDGIANTATLEHQPEHQPVPQFERKIRKLINNKSPRG
jgi:hypothetical protein